MSADNETNGLEIELRPTEFLTVKSEQAKASDAGQYDSTALIILNSPIYQYQYFYRLYNNSSFCVCADGAANRLHDLLLSNHPKLEWQDALRTALPDVVHGDLDSLDYGVREKYEQLGVEISKDPDQYSTDFGKSVKKVVERMPYVQNVLVLGSIGGRLDQGIGLLDELYREQTVEHPGTRFWLFSEASISMVLQPGSTVIHTPVSEGLIKRNVGILPVYGRAVISTKGLEWDVKDWPTEMGGQISTNNHIETDTITVKTTEYVLFTVERVVDG